MCMRSSPCSCGDQIDLRAWFIVLAHACAFVRHAFVFGCSCVVAHVWHASVRVCMWVYVSCSHFGSRLMASALPRQFQCRPCGHAMRNSFRASVGIEVHSCRVCLCVFGLWAVNRCGCPQGFGPHRLPILAWPLQGIWCTACVCYKSSAPAPYRAITPLEANLGLSPKGPTCGAHGVNVIDGLICRICRLPK